MFVEEIAAYAFGLFIVPTDGVINLLLRQVEKPDIHCRLYFAITSS
jgi:hypothetical protein